MGGTDLVIAGGNHMNNSKLLIIAPMPPLRGGIPWHSHHLARNLKKLHATAVWTPKKLFPNFLYPGESQFENESEQEAQPPRLPDRSLTKIGILIRLLSLSPNEFQAVLVPWWTSYFSLHTITIATVLRLKGVTPAIFCHNAYPHNASSLEKALSRLVIRQFKKVFVQSQDEYYLVKSFHPKANLTIINHPPYPRQRPPNRRHYKPSENNGPIKVLFFGFIREYKGIDTLLEAAKKVSDGEFHFHFVGESWSDSLTKKIGSASNKHPNITHELSYVSRSALQSVFDSCDVVVLPNSQSTGSGALATAKGMGVPVIISDRIDPGPEFVEGRDGIIFPVGDSPRLLSALQQFRENISDFDQCWVAIDHDKEWDLIAVKIVEELGL
jgi:glycosyltransferase involved in cell wall biosynthesis